MSTTSTPRTAARGWLDSLAAGLLAGGLGGLLFLGVGLADVLFDFLAYWPTRGYAAALIVRSIGLYALLGGGAGLLLGGLFHPFAGAGRGRQRVFALVLGTMVAVTALAYLTAWWQVEVLAGQPMDDPDRRRAAVAHVAAALAAGAAAGLLCLKLAPARWPRAGVRTAVAALVPALALVLAGELGLGASPGRGEGGGGRPGQVVVVGLDGMTLRVLSPLLRAGEMPTFRRLMDEGAWGTLLTYGTASSPRVWTSMATGKRVRDHGIDDFVKVRHASYRALPAKSSDRRARALWNILSDFGRRVAVVNWLITYPPEEVNGYMVSRLTLDAAGRTFPAELDADLDELWGEPPRDDRQRLLWDVDRVFAAAAHLLRKERLDFLALFDAAADRVEHTTWKYYESEKFDPETWDVEEADAAAAATLVPDVYRHLDRRLGELLEQAADDALVIVVSDHGQLAAPRPRVRLQLDRILEALGYARLEPDGRGGRRLDTAASRAYTLVETPWTPVLRVNVNLAGRERQGIVAREEAAAVADRLVADLSAVRFDDGKPLFGRVRRAKRILRRQGGSADVEVPLSRHARGVERAARLLDVGGERRPLADFQTVHTSVSGDHDHQGVIFARGPGVAPGPIGPRAVPTALNVLLWHLTDKFDAVDRLLPPLRRLGLIEQATTLDLTPTVLHALGLPVGRDMAGRPLVELFSRPPAVEWIASYETLGGQRLAAEEALSDQEYLERLRALGYVN